MLKKSNSKVSGKTQTAAPDKVVKTTPPRNSPVPKPIAMPPVARKEITHEMIAKRAYEISLGSGGDEMYNWLAAERELRGS